MLRASRTRRGTRRKGTVADVSGSRVLCSVVGKLMPVMEMHDIHDAVSREEMERIVRETLRHSQFVFACVCGNQIKTPALKGKCPSCGRMFDISGWGK